MTKYYRYGKIKMMKQYSIGISLIILTFVTILPFAFGQPASEEMRLVVFDFNPHNTNSEDKITASEKVYKALAGTKEYKVFERKELKKILEEQKLSNTDLFDKDTAISIGGLMGANMAVNGDLYKKGNEYLLSCNLLDVKTGECLFNIERRHESLDVVCEEVARKIRERIVFGEVKIAVVYRASSELKPESDEVNYRVSNAFDMNMNTSWTADRENYAGWIEVKFSNSVTFKGIKLYTKADRLKKGVPNQFSIEYKENGQWKKALEVLNNTWDDIRKNFDTSHTSNFWRIKVDSVVTQGVPVTITELEFLE